MFSAILTVHIILCFVLIVLVLLQQGKGADAGAAFGGGANTLFGASGANSLMVKVTTGVAIAFFITSVGLIKVYATEAKNSVGVSSESSLIDKIASENQVAATPTTAATIVPPEAAKTKK